MSKNYLIWLTVFTFALFGIIGRSIYAGFPTDILSRSMICFHAIFVVVNWINVAIYLWTDEEHIEQIENKLTGD